MGKHLHVAAVAFAAIACVLFIVSTASPAWLIGCLSYDNIFKAMESHPQLKELAANYDEGAKMLSGMKMCIHIGQFKLTMKAGNLLDVSIGMDITSMTGTVFCGVAAVIISIILGAVGAILLLVAIGGDTNSYEGKAAVAKHTQVGMILLVLAGCTGLVGMAAYTGGTVQASNDPLMFLAQVGVSAGSAFQNIVSGRSPYGRSKRDLSLSGIPPDMQQYINTMIKGMEPSYGYAFALGWVAVVCMFISAVLSTVAKQRLYSQPYSEPSNMKL